MAASFGKVCHVCCKQAAYRQFTKRSIIIYSQNGIHTSNHVLADESGSDTFQHRETKAKKISRAMKMFMERAKEHEALMGDEVTKYELGKHHLARIMGEDPANFTQDSIDQAIEYLLPSGLFDKKARPMFKHPMDIFPAQKAAQFGYDGRPHHYLFYTGKPNFFAALHDIGEKYEDLCTLENKFIREGSMATEEGKSLNIQGFNVLDLTQLQRKMNESITPAEHNRYKLLIERLIKHPLSHREEEFLLQYATKFQSVTQDYSAVKPEVDKDGREFVVANGKRKTSRATVVMWNKGTGDVKINDTDLSYFKNSQEKMQLMFPLQLVNRLGKVDFKATVREGGPASQAGAIRLALAKAVCSFIGADARQSLRLAGLLTTDPRIKEREKPGRPKARKKPTWKKR